MSSRSRRIFLSSGIKKDPPGITEWVLERSDLVR
jgi:hypothetical protein